MKFFQIESVGQNALRFLAQRQNALATDHVRAGLPRIDEVPFDLCDHFFLAHARVLRLEIRQE